MVRSIINYIASNIWGFFVFTITSILLYLVVRLVIFLIRYVIFKKIIKSLVDAAFDDEDDNEYYNKPSSYTEDEKLHEKNKHKDTLSREAERLNEQSAEFSAKLNRKKIVGVSFEGRILGPWTQKIAEKLMKDIMNLNPGEIQNLGYYQAMVLSQERSKGIQKDRTPSR
jgi:hypothetical protein